MKSPRLLKLGLAAVLISASSAPPSSAADSVSVMFDWIPGGWQAAWTPMAANQSRCASRSPNGQCGHVSRSSHARAHRDTDGCSTEAARHPLTVPGTDAPPRRRSRIERHLGIALPSCDDHGMQCPFCDDQETRVIDSRLALDGAQVRRRRECTSCRERFTTYEAAEVAIPRIVKNGRNPGSFRRAQAAPGHGARDREAPRGQRRDRGPRSAASSGR